MDTDVPTPRTKWEFSLQSSPTTSPLLHAGTAFVGCKDHYLYAIDVPTGTERFRTDVGGEIGPGLTIADGVVYGSGTNGVFGVDGRSGDLRLAVSTIGVGAGTRTPLVRDDRLYYPANDELYAIDLGSGGQLWRMTVSSILGGRPAFAGDVLVTSDAGDVDTFPSERSRIYGLDPTDGTQRWKTTVETDSLVSPVATAPERNLAVLVGRYGTTAAFGTTSGEERWRSTVQRDGNVTGRPLVLEDTVFVPLGRNGLFAYDLVSGERRWSVSGRDDIDLGYEIRVVGDRLVTGRHSIYELDPDTGDRLTEYSPPSSLPHNLQPALTSDAIVYPTGDSSVRKIPRT